MDAKADEEYENRDDMVLLTEIITNSIYWHRSVFEFHLFRKI